MTPTNRKKKSPSKKGSKQAYLDEMDSQIKEWGTRVKDMKARVTKGAAGVQTNYHNLLERWQEKEATLKHKMEELRLASTASFETMKSGVQNVWNEIDFLIASLKEK